MKKRVHGLVVVAALAVGCSGEGTVDGENVGSVTSALSTGFTWRMAERLVREDGMLNITPGKSFIHDDRHLVTFDACDLGFPDGEDVSYSWIVHAFKYGTLSLGEESVETTYHAEPFCELTLDLGREGAPVPGSAMHYQGFYQVQLEIDDPATPGIDFSDFQDVEVKDHLIVSLGDSVASGEGNPDYSEAYDWGIVGSIELPTFGIIEFGPEDPNPVWVDEECHRSQWSGPAQAALALEQADPHSSVTFLSLACTGAILLFEGLDIGVDFDSLQVLELTDRLCPPDDPTDCRTVDEDGGFPDPEVLDPGRLRKIDALLLSAGANNAYFSTIAAECAADSDCLDEGTDLRRDVVFEVNSLDYYYEEFDDLALSKLNYEGVYLTQYQDVSRGNNGKYCSEIEFVGAVEDEYGALVELAFDASIERHVLRTIDEIMFKPMIEIQAETAAELGWTYVSGIAADFKTHGYCATEPWVVSYGASKAIQGDIDGTLHPNYYGHQAIARRIVDALAPDLSITISDEPPPPVYGPSVDPDPLLAGFEAGSPNEWQTVEGTAFYHLTTKTQGTSSIELGTGNSEVASPPFTTDVLRGRPTGTAFLLDVYVPAEMTTSGAGGTVTMAWTVPELADPHQSLGGVDITALSAGWNTVQFPISPLLRLALMGSHEGVQLFVGAQTDPAASEGVRVDNLRVAGETDAVCDGFDGDYDGEIDEDFTPWYVSCGVGACFRTANVSCVDGVIGDACVAGVPTPEQNDGVDNDCDGETDEFEGTADAGPDQVVECSGDGTATVTLDGEGSTATSGVLSFQWSAPDGTIESENEAIATGTFPVGTRTVTLAVGGPAGDTDTAEITVVDTTAPALSVPPDVVVSSCGAVELGQATAADACSGALEPTNDAPPTFSAGVHTVTWQVSDPGGNTTTKTQRVVVGLGGNPACCPADSNLVMGTSNDDELYGTSGPDCIVGLGGQDTIFGYGGNDVISGGEGDDVIEGGDGDDVIEGGNGQDTLSGQSNDDALFGGGGDDHLYGGGENDVLLGGDGQDHLHGSAGNDSLFGESGDDRLYGGAGDDSMNGGGLHDVCTDALGINEFIDCESASASCTPTTYQAELITRSVGGASPPGWNIWGNGYVSTYHPFEAGPTTITVVAKGQAALGIWPNMVVSVGGVVLGNVAVASSSYAPYTFGFSAVAGSQEVRVSFTNDYYGSAGQDRNLFVDELTVGCDAGASPTCFDGVANGAETDVDCGGGACGACPAGGTCLTHADCASGVCAGGACQAVAASVYPFESGTLGWTNIGTPGYGSQSSTDVASAGSRSLKLNVNGSGDPTISVTPPGSLVAGTTVTLRVFVPSGAPVVAIAPYVLDANWTWSDAYTSAVVKGAWQTFSITVPWGVVLPLNRLGVKFYLNGSYSGALYIDEVAW